MTKKELRDSIEMLSKYTEMLKEEVDDKNYAKAWEIASASRYRVSEICEDIENKWYDQIRQKNKEG